MQMPYPAITILDLVLVDLVPLHFEMKFYCGETDQNAVTKYVLFKYSEEFIVLSFHCFVIQS